MEKKLKEILSFFKKNEAYNKSLQIKFALNSIGSEKGSFNKLAALLYDTINTQRTPDIDNTAEFMKKIYDNKNNLESFADFFQLIVNKQLSIFTKKEIYCQLYKGLLTQKGWGEKTSALLIKNIYNYHYNFNTFNELEIWQDVPTLEDDAYKLNLPVDAVIITTFNKLSPNHKPQWNFKTINRILHKEFTNEEIILFDDLWFWGFITQDSSKLNNEENISMWDDKRKMCFNKNKYWTIKESNKDTNYIEDVKKLATEEFLKIIISKDTTDA